MMDRIAVLRKVDGRPIRIGGVDFVLTKQGGLYTKVAGGGGYTFATRSEVDLVKDILRRESESRRQARGEIGGISKKKKKRLVKNGRRGIGSIIGLEPKRMPALAAGHARRHFPGENTVYGFTVSGKNFVAINGIRRPKFNRPRG